MAVLAEGAVAPIEMLLNLWGTQDMEGTRDEADGLVSKSLLQGVGGDEYRVHDLVLDFLNIKITADEEIMGNATALQAQYLGRLDVVKSYENPEHGVLVTKACSSWMPSGARRRSSRETRGWRLPRTAPASENWSRARRLRMWRVPTRPSVFCSTSRASSPRPRNSTIMHRLYRITSWVQNTRRTGRPGGLIGTSEYLVEGRHNEALPLLERASSTRRTKLGENHHYTVDTQISLERVQKHIGEQETNMGPRGTKHPEEAW
ncbi:unnamed protein product [Ectocarpus sp. 12 AP-2014]